MFTTPCFIKKDTPELSQEAGNYRNKLVKYLLLLFK